MRIKLMTRLIAVLLGAFFFLFISFPAQAADITMGSGGNLVFEPKIFTIKAGETVTFTNGELPPHNVIVEDHPELSHEGLAFAPGEEFDLTFDEPGEYSIYCGPHQGAGMTATIVVE